MIKFEFTKDKCEDVKDIDRILASVKSRCKYLVSGRYVLTVKKRTTPRTLQQNALYRLWLNMMSQQTGNPVSVLHEFFKSEFLPCTIIDVFGRIVEVKPTTKTLTTKCFSEFLDKVQAFASSELGMILPTPQDALAEDMYNEFYFNENE